ncbi:multiubiquitin domain-containing protein [Paracoccus sp. (in: a-proteobacteria)]|uniref:multiubiquitin domain-containing protein n=1 Tax=Paracoccus sp. TaxID=267 RepID=UPI003A872A40
MTELSEDAADRDKRRRIEVADETLTYRNVLIDDLTPTGAQLAAAAGFKPKQHAVVLQVLANGELEDVRPSETVDLKRTDVLFHESQRRQLVQIGAFENQFSCPGELVGCHSTEGILHERMPDRPALIDPANFKIAREFQFKRLE